MEKIQEKCKKHVRNIFKTWDFWPDVYEFQFVVGSGVALEFVIDGDMKAQLTNTLDMSSKK